MLLFLNNCVVGRGRIWWQYVLGPVADSRCTCRCLQARGSFPAAAGHPVGAQWRGGLPERAVGPGARRGERLPAAPPARPARQRHQDEGRAGRAAGPRHQRRAGGPAAADPLLQRPPHPGAVRASARRRHPPGQSAGALQDAEGLWPVHGDGGRQGERQWGSDSGPSAEHSTMTPRRDGDNGDVTRRFVTVTWSDDGSVTCVRL